MWSVLYDVLSMCDMQNKYVKHMNNSFKLKFNEMSELKISCKNLK